MWQMMRVIIWSRKEEDNMKISKQTASQIVRQLSDTIGQNINIMDTEGVIIASTNPERIGKLHGGAVKLIREHLSLVTVEDDTQFEGAKSGINLPIEFENELIGIIGITGPVNEVTKYGQIIKKMTEILLLEQKAQSQRVIEEKALERFLDEWILGELEIKSEADFRRIAATFNIDPEKPMRIVTISCIKDDRLTDEILTEISRYTRHEIHRELNGMAFRTATQIVCIIPAENEDNIIAVFTSIISYIKTRFKFFCHCGVDERSAAFSLHRNYLEAAKALEIAKGRNSNIVMYDPLDLEFMIGTITPEAKKEFLRKLFKQTAPDEIKSHLEFAEAYLAENGSLKALSERLFIHINTVKYKIQKLTEVTGIDIRTCSGAYYFTLAVKFMT